MCRLPQDLLQNCTTSKFNVVGRDNVATMYRRGIRNKCRRCDKVIIMLAIKFAGQLRGKASPIELTLQHYCEFEAVFASLRLQRKLLDGC